MSNILTLRSYHDLDPSCSQWTSQLPQFINGPPRKTLLFAKSHYKSIEPYQFHNGEPEMSLQTFPDSMNRSCNLSENSSTFISSYGQKCILALKKGYIIIKRTYYMSKTTLNIIINVKITSIV